MRQIAAVVIVHPTTRDVLLLRRGKTDLWRPRCWNLPGGHLDPGESYEQAVRREAWEEAGQKLGQLTPWVVQECPGKQTVIFWAWWEHDPVCMLDGENDAWTWVSRTSLMRYPLIPDLYPLLSEMLP